MTCLQALWQVISSCTKAEQQRFKHYDFNQVGSWHLSTLFQILYITS